MAKKILLADDSITIQKVVELTFSDGDYEVTAVNNGARAIQKLGEMRPDIILSDIIMPEKNGYEVCEFVKSHPEYRNIPVVLLTGTFEPFDPDRADKAGCDAVVTKPFESQSLIHKVEELIELAQKSAPAPAAAPAPPAPAPQPVAAAAPPPPPPPPPAPAPAPEASPWVDDVPASSPFASSSPAFQQNDNDIFSAASGSGSSSTDMPFTPPPSGAETRAISAMPFDDRQASTQQVPAQAGETRAFPKMDFSSLGGMETPAPPPAPSASESDDSPFGAPPSADPFRGETRAFPKMSLDDFAKMGATTPPPPPPPAPAPPATRSPWEDTPAPAGETRAFPSMSFDELNRAAGSQAPAWSSPAESPEIETSAPAPFSEPEPMSFDEDVAEEPMSRAEQPAWSMPEPARDMPSIAPAAASPAPSSSSNGSADLTDDQVDRIARRVVQLMSDQVVRNIAWEVIPDLAEMVVKERIRQLESEG